MQIFLFLARNIFFIPVRENISVRHLRDHGNEFEGEIHWTGSKKITFRFLFFKIFMLGAKKNKIKARLRGNKQPDHVSLSLLNIHGSS